eukprot:3779373-Rhodomonas_salina.1
MSVEAWMQDGNFTAVNPVNLLLREDALRSGLVPSEQMFKMLVSFSMIMMTVTGCEIVGGSWLSLWAVRMIKISSVSLLSFAGKIVSSGTVAWHNLPRVLNWQNLNRLLEQRRDSHAGHRFGKRSSPL